MCVCVCEASQEERSCHLSAGEVGTCVVIHVLCGRYMCCVRAVCRRGRYIKRVMERQMRRPKAMSCHLSVMCVCVCVRRGSHSERERRVGLSCVCVCE